MTETPTEKPGRFAYEGLERTLHEKARLGIMTSLLAHADGLLFSDLKEMCSLTDGNLNRHLKVLQDEGLVGVWKGHNRNRPQTMLRVTADGRKRFLEYLTVLEQVLADAAVVSGSAATKTILQQQNGRQEDDS